MAKKIAKYNKRLESLRSERSSFMDVWRDLSDYHLAHRGRFLVSDRNKGYQRNTKQINNTSRLSSRTLASGMMAGITSPARPWFRLAAGNTDLSEHADVKQWLHEVQTRMYEVFSASNLYNSLHQIYGELGTFGTAAMGVYEDFEDVIFCKPYTVGSYMLGANGKNEIDSFYREYQLSVGQVIKQFGIDNVSNHVKNLWEHGGSESWIDIVHVIEPNDDRDQMTPLARNMPYRSVYYEKGTRSQKDDLFLRESGFEDFAIMAPRWDITGEDIYATDCPGMIALGGTKALQLGERRMYQALDKLLDPPLQGPSSMKSKVGRSLRNGEIVWTGNATDALSPIYGNWKPDLGAVVDINNRTEDRIKSAFYEDLFLMLANSDRRQITAREIAEKHEEKLLMLGPVLERLHTELLDPLIDRTFNILQRNGVLPPPPDVLADSEITVTYVSVMAQAQQLVAAGSIERLSDYVGNISAVWPEARHKFDALQAIDDYSEVLGVSPQVVRADDEANERIAAEQQAAQQAQGMAMGQQLADTAKTASETEMEGDNALTNIMQRAGLG